MAAGRGAADSGVSSGGTCPFISADRRGPRPGPTGRTRDVLPQSTANVRQAGHHHGWTVCPRHRAAFYFGELADRLWHPDLWDDLRSALSHATDGRQRILLIFLSRRGDDPPTAQSLGYIVSQYG